MKNLIIFLIFFTLLFPLYAFSLNTQANDLFESGDELEDEFMLNEGIAEDDNLKPLDFKKGSRASSRVGSPPPVQMQQAIGNIIEGVSPHHIETYLNKLVGFGSRLYRAPGMYNASKWLHDVLNGNGRIKAEYHNFTTTTSWGTFLLNNVILTLPGLNSSSDDVYYMYAHSDAVQRTDSSQWLTNTPGADDDGSGCASVLEAARVLSRYDFHDTIKFAFFNAEEIGLRGSRKYMQDMAALNEDIKGGIDYDMIGHTTGNPMYGLNLHFHSSSAFLAQYLEDVNSRYEVGLTLNPVQKTGSLRSDIDSFYNQGYPSVMGIETEFSPYYHSLQDTPDKLNYTFMGKSTMLATASLAEWARLIYTDLSIPAGNLNISNLNPDDNEIVNVTVNVSNSGNLDAVDMEVAFYSNGMQFSSTRMDVPANGTNITTAQWNPTVGAHNITVVLDPKNEIVETDETNNSAFAHVDVNDAPKAVLTATPVKVLTFDEVSFDGSFSLDNVGGISEYNFSFGDGNLTGWTAEPSINHNYSEDGSYRAVLIVRDIYGAVSSESDITITVLNRAPVASPSSNLTRTLTYVPIQFISNAFDLDGVVTTSWDFGDGEITEAADPVHEFSRSGEYDVQLDIKDNDNARASYNLKVLIDNRPPFCSINTSTSSGTIETGFSLKADSSDLDGTVVAFKWDMGDGTTGSKELMEHRYSTPGTYTVHLEVEDDEGSRAQASHIIIVLDTPPVAVAEAVLYEVYTYEKILFLGDKSYDLEGEISFAWDFGDSNTSSESTPIHTFMEPGTYYSKLIVRDSAGNFDMVNLTPIKVNNRAPDAEFRFFGNLTENGTVYFDGSNSTDVEGKVTYSWNFGDGNNHTGAVVGYVFPAHGDYVVYLTVTDEHGSSSTVQNLVTVTAPPVRVEPEKTDTAVQSEESQFSDKAVMAMNILWLAVLIIVVLWAVAYRKRKAGKIEGGSDVPTFEQAPFDNYAQAQPGTPPLAQAAHPMAYPPSQQFGAPVEPNSAYLLPEAQFSAEQPVQTQPVPGYPPGDQTYPAEYQTPQDYPAQDFYPPAGQPVQAQPESTAGYDPQPFQPQVLPAKPPRPI
jgi:PKD repeat protein